MSTIEWEVGVALDESENAPTLIVHVNGTYMETSLSIAVGDAIRSARNLVKRHEVSKIEVWIEKGVNDDRI